jgi:hypothetical protein
MRAGEAIQGTLVVRRTAGGRTSVEGTWQRSIVRFTRVTGEGRTEPFVGISVNAPDGTIRMAGRFGDAFDGVWSASCAQAGESDEPEPAAPEPSREATPTPPAEPEPAPTEPPVPTPTASSCSIAGAATGPRADAAKVFGVMLFGPNDDKRFRGRQPFGTGRYSFSNLPDGRYIVVPDTKADIPVQVIPRRREVVCQGGAIGDANFEFR